MRVEDIKDRKSLIDWLKGRPEASRRADAIAIAHRAVLRVLPLWSGTIGQAWARDADVTALPLFRTCLTSAVDRKNLMLAARQPAGVAAAALAPLRPISKASIAFAAVDAAVSVAVASASDTSSTAASAAGLAVASAAAGAKYADAGASARAYESTIFDDYVFDTGIFDTPAAAAFWSELRADARRIQGGIDPSFYRIWSAYTPNWFTQADLAARAIWAAAPETWSFWLRWWDGVVAGRPLPDELLLKVALIPDETWKAGPAAVAEAIRVIEAHHALDMVISQNPYAWRIVFDPRRQTFEAVAIEPRDLSEIVTSVRGLIKDFHKRCDKLGVGNFGASVKLAFEPVIDFLRRDMRRHAASPLSLLKAIEAARREMQEIADKEHFAGESYLTRFFLGLQDCAEDICVAAPEIVEQLKAKEAVRYELFSMERRRATMLQVFGLHLDADGMLKRVALDALRVIGDDTASDADKKEAWYFATAVLPRAARAYLAETLDKDEELKPPSKVAMTKRVVEAADALAKLDKGKDALTENIPQLADWVNQIVEAVSTWSV